LANAATLQWPRTCHAATPEAEMRVSGSDSYALLFMLFYMSELNTFTCVYMYFQRWMDAGWRRWHQFVRQDAWIMSDFHCRVTVSNRHSPTHFAYLETLSQQRHLSPSGYLTLRPQDTSAPDRRKVGTHRTQDNNSDETRLYRWFGLNLVPKCPIGLVPKCPDTSAPGPKCPDISAPFLWCRNVLVPKCLVAEVSGSPSSQVGLRQRHYL